MYFQLPSVMSPQLQSVPRQRVRPQWKCLHLIFTHLGHSHPALPCPSPWGQLEVLLPDPASSLPAPQPAFQRLLPRVLQRGGVCPSPPLLRQGIKWHKVPPGQRWSSSPGAGGSGCGKEKIPSTVSAWPGKLCPDLLLQSCQALVPLVLGCS